MLNDKDLKEEKKYLSLTQSTLDNAIKILNKGIEESEQGLDELSKFIALSFYEMDKQEASVQRSMLEKLQLDCLDLKRKLYLLNKQKESPYFGRIDFIADDDKTLLPLYIGIAHIGKQGYNLPLVIDWRAPISTLYYDFEKGRCSYIAPMGEISGEITLKRQYKIQGNKIIYAFNSNLTIGDEILREALGQSSDDKMKNIVATIQKEQNKIIRGDEFENMLIQGIAGSGKTSIALHRVAYLLYKNKISSKDILILSPSVLFSDYISDVLPELGEENTPKITFEEIAKRELFGFLHFESRADMIETLLKENFLKQNVNYNNINLKELKKFNKNLKNLNSTQCTNFYKNKIINKKNKYLKYSHNNNLRNFYKNNRKIYLDKNLKRNIYYINNFSRLQEIQFKSSFNFFEKLQNFCFKHLKTIFHAKDVAVGSVVFKAEQIQNLYQNRYADKKPAIKIEWIADHIVDQLNLSRQNEKIIFNRIKKVLYNMFENTSIISIYSKFLNEVGLKLHYTYNKEKQNNLIRFEDVPALLYIKDFLLGIETHNTYKHIIIDEMQDYSPIALYLLNIIFNCKKTILGDVNQCLERKLSSNYLKKLQIILNAKLRFLNSTYRSTRQISEYSQSIINLKNSANFNRNGVPVKSLSINLFNNVNNISLSNEFIQNINNEIDRLSKIYKKIAVIVSTSFMGKYVYDIIDKSMIKNVKLIDKTLGRVGGLVNVIPVVFSKGLEFDAVIVVNEFSNKTTDLLQQNFLYIATTRALHELIVFNNLNK